MKTNLKKCPFCGSKAVLINTGNHWPKVFYRIICQTSCTMQANLYDTAEEAIEAWNKRVPLACFDEYEV